MRLIIAACLLFGCGAAAPVQTEVEQPEPERGPPALELAPQARPAVIEDHLACGSPVAEARASFDAAVAASEHGDTLLAIEAYRSALKYDPAFCDALDNLGLLRRQQGELGLAVELYERSISVKPDNVVAWQNLGVARLLEGNLEQAAAAYQKLVGLNPYDPEGYYGLGTVLLQSGRPDQALDALNQAASIYENQGSPLVRDAKLLQSLALALTGDCPGSTALMAELDPKRLEPAVTTAIAVACPPSAP